MNLELLLATNNAHKLYEYRKILSPYGITIYSPKDLNIELEEMKEDGKCYFDNALIKAKSAQKITKFPVFADDTGLEVESLDNFPGLHTHRFAISSGTQILANKSLIEKSKNTNRKARFVCDICLLINEEKPLKFEGIIEGKIADKEEGLEGFGYDPIFIPKGHKKSFAVLGEKEKNQISHRAKACLKLVAYLKINNLI